MNEIKIEYVEINDEEEVHIGDYYVSFEAYDKALKEIFAKYYGLTMEQTKKIFCDFEMYDQMEEVFKEEIKDYFREAAYEQFEDNKAYEDKNFYYGV